MFSSKRRLTPHVYNNIPCGFLDFPHSNFYQPSMIDDFLFETLPTVSGDAVAITSDISMLFNQRRLDRMSREALIQHFESMSVRNSKFADIRSKLSDDQLCSIVKSRYIQSPSELMAYSNYLVST